jgi:glycosyltransferase involved in cell wall biosynthesis
MSVSQPLVSVILPVKNGMPFLADAIDSILSQTWTNLELVVVNDGSTDGTAAYLAGLRSPRIRVIDSPAAGFAAARDAGIQAARGELLARMDADDISSPARIESQAAFLERNPDIVGVGAQVRFMVDGIETDAFSYPLDPVRILSLLRSGRVVLCDSVMMFRADAARRIHPKVKGPGGDFDFYLRLAACGPIVNLDRPLQTVRITETSVSYLHIDSQLLGKDFSLACDRARRAGVPEPDFESFHRDWADRTRLQVATTWFRVMHQRLFRDSIIKRAHGRKVRAFLDLALAAALYPPAAWYQAKRALLPLD